MLLTADSGDVGVVTPAASLVPGNVDEPGYEGLDTNTRRHIMAVNDVLDVIEDTVRVIKRQSQRPPSYESAYAIGTACGELSVAIRRWRPDGVRTPEGWEEFNRRFVRALKHYARGADLVAASDDGGLDELKLAHRLMQEAFEAAPEGAL